MNVIKQGINTYVREEDHVKRFSKLSAGVYTLMYDANTCEFYLEDHKDFELPETLYGETLTQSVRIINTFKQREGNTGVMLSGKKGSGKTLLAKVISSKCIEEGCPVILINNAYYGDDFVSFISKIEQPIVLFFDEFEKKYSDEKSKDSLLSFFDGTFDSKVLSIVTCNKKHLTSQYILNRPGRMYYSISFTGLSLEFIKEYAEKNLVDQSEKDGLLKVSGMLMEVNFDMLQALVEEMNRYNESALESVKYLNVEPDTTRTTYEVVSLMRDGNSYTPDDKTVLLYHPAFMENFTVYGSQDDFVPEDEDSFPDSHFVFCGSDLVSSKDGVYVFRNKHGELKLKTKEEQSWIMRGRSLGAL